MKPDYPVTTIETFFARQPIFDGKGELLAYELLYRPAPDAQAANGATPGAMSAQVTVDALLGGDIRTVTNGRPAFVNLTRDMLINGMPPNIDPSLVVIEVLETIEPDDDVVQACRRFRDQGFTLALDDYFENDPRHVLLPYAAIVKIDVLDRSMDAVRSLVDSLRGANVRLLAERVETQDVHAACAAAGFECFQGYFYRKPELVQQRDLRPEQMRIIEAMNLVRDPDVPDRKLGAFFKTDPTLSYKVVRMANVAAIGVRNIESVQHAITIVGRDSLFRWLGLLLAASFGRGAGTRQELLREALVRARMCEELATSAGTRGHLFLVGLFSRIESLIGAPSRNIVDSIAFPQPVVLALVDRAGPYAPILSVAEACEDDQFDALPSLALHAGVDTRGVPTAYRVAIDWAQAVTRNL